MPAQKEITIHYKSVNYSSQHPCGSHPQLWDSVLFHALFLNNCIIVLVQEYKSSASSHVIGENKKIEIIHFNLDFGET